VRSSVANRRIRLLLLGLAAVFTVVLVRAVWLQIVRAEPLSRLALTQHRQTVEVPAGRGTIYDRGGVQLALGEAATTVFADPRQIEDARRVAAAAAKHLELEASELVPELADRSRGFVYVRRKAEPERAAALAKLSLAGIGFYPEERRAYPQRSVGAHLLGYAGVDNRGLAGLERELDGVLTGRPGTQTIVKDPFGRLIDVVAQQAEREGSDVYLTIDHNLQANAEAVLQETISRWRAKAASAVVLDPRTGAVLAMAVAPRFDANRFGSVSSGRTRNRAVTDVYEPGSTFKLVTAAAALSEGLVSPTTTFTLPYSIRVADRTIHEAHPRPTRRMTVSEIISASSNIGTVTLAQMLGADRLSRWIERFGFGRATGVEFPGESPGIVLPLEHWSGSSIGTIPIGQGIAVTPVQMAAAYAALANGGVWVQPHLVERIEGRARPRVERRRVVTRVVSQQMLAMLRHVVDDQQGTGVLAAVPGYKVAGKTGTAAKPDENGYSTWRYVASFVGIVPASDPRLVVLVTVDEPRNSIWGGVVAAPAFAQISRFALQYLEVRPDAELAEQ
jgi:cell division protein FtsI/penicillin-binding protein 2